MEVDTLKEKLNTLLAQSNARQAKRIEDRTQAMEVLNERLERFDALTKTWLEQVIVPRLSTLAELLPTDRTSRVERRAFAAVFERESTEEFPASAEVAVRFAHDPDIERARLAFEVRIIPVLMEYDRGAAIDVELNRAETDKIAAFLDDRICRFAADYLRVREPESRYQKSQLVTDPVCGMTFHRWEAATSLQHEGITLYFCMEECRKRFEADPAAYLR